MDIRTIKAHIKTGKFNPYYIFTGPERAVMRIYISQMAKALGCAVENLESITDLAKILNGRSMLKISSVRVLFDDKSFMLDERLRASMTQKMTSVDVPTIFVYTSIDKRTKFYKDYQNEIVEFNPLATDVLANYVVGKIDLSDSSAKDLVEISENDYARTMLEVNKIYTYAKAMDIDHERAYKKLVNDGTIYVPPYDAVFDFVDAVLKRKVALAFDLLAQSYASGEATMVLLSNLYNGAKQVLQVQAYTGTGKITEVTGLTPFQVKLASGRKNVYRNGELVYLMKLVKRVETGIKSGEIEDDLAVQYILVNFWGIN